MGLLYYGRADQKKTKSEEGSPVEDNLAWGKVRSLGLQITKKFSTKKKKKKEKKKDLSWVKKVV